MTQTALTRRSSLSPLEATGSFFNGLDQALFRRFFTPFWSSSDWSDSYSSAGFVPPVDVAETADAYELSAELPGMSKDDIEITLENQALVLSGERRLESGDEATLHRRERGYGRFSRTFALPKAVAADRISACFKDGVLSVTAPKAPEARAQRIAVN